MTNTLDTRLDVKVLQVTTGGALIGWNGHPSVRYTVALRVFPLGEEVFSEVTGVQYGVSALEPGRLHVVRIIGGGKQGGTTFTPIDEDTPVTPGKPPKVRYVDVHYNTNPRNFSFTWSSVDGEGVGYIVRYYKTSDPGTVVEVRTSAPQVNVTGLSTEGDGIYRIEVSAVNAIGESEPAGTFVSTHSTGRPTKVTPKTGEVGPTTIELSWERYGSHRSYEISHHLMPRPDFQVENSAVFSGLAPKSRYSFRLVSIGEGGVFSESSYVDVDTAD